jgi:hypothetical protein
MPDLIERNSAPDAGRNAIGAAHAKHRTQVRSLAALSERRSSRRRRDERATARRDGPCDDCLRAVETFRHERTGGPLGAAVGRASEVATAGSAERTFRPLLTCDASQSSTSRIPDVGTSTSFVATTNHLFVLLVQ